MAIVKDRSDCDRLAGNLIEMAALGRRMPPAWDGARVSVPVCGPDGQYVGRILPGRGLYSAIDLKRAGITRGHLPHVFEPSLTQRLIEKFGGRDLGPEWSERGVLKFYDDIVAARAGGRGQDVALSKVSINTVANAYHSLFQAGGLPVAGTYTAIPGGAVHSRVSAGAWSFGLTNPTSPNLKYLLTIGFTSSVTLNMLMLVDLLVAAGGINANLSTLQTVNSVALSRYTSGAGVMMTFDVTTQLGATPANLTVVYTNQGGASGTTPATAVDASAILTRLEPSALGPFMQLAAGDYGVQSVQSVTFSAAMGAGVVALNLYVPLAFLPGVAGFIYVERDSNVQIDGLTQLLTDVNGVLGCLVGYAFANTTLSGVLTAFMRTAEG